MKRILLCVLAILSVCLWSPAVEEVYRVLTSKDGKEMKAWIRKVENDQVTFRREDNKVFTVSLTSLSEEDQTELKKMQAAAPAKPAAPVPDAKVNKRLYPRALSEMKTACTAIREAAKAAKNFTDEEKDAIAELNIYRYLSGVPSEVPLDRKCCDVAVKAGEGCATIGKLSHDVVPEGKSCNLHQGQADFAHSVHGYMEDPGDNNREERGHRMWCLHPDMPKSGFGCDKTKKFFGMWVSNGGLAPGKGKGRGRAADFHAYPGNGFYPAKRFRGNGWSIYPAAALPGNEQPEIKVYELTSRPASPITATTVPKDAKEAVIEFKKVTSGAKGGWAGGWVVFEPKVEVDAGKIYWVSLKCGTVRISYVVEFTEGDF